MSLRVVIANVSCAALHLFACSQGAMSTAPPPPLTRTLHHTDTLTRMRTRTQSTERKGRHEVKLLKLLEEWFEAKKKKKKASLEESFLFQQCVNAKLDLMYLILFYFLLFFMPRRRHSFRVRILLPQKT